MKYYIVYHSIRALLELLRNHPMSAVPPLYINKTLLLPSPTMGTAWEEATDEGQTNTTTKPITQRMGHKLL